MTRRLSPSRKAGWREYVDGEPRVRPDRRSMAQLQALSDSARDDYNEARHDWHPNIPIIETPQLAYLHGEIDQIVGSNRHDAGRIRGVVAIDALPGLGKSTIAETFGRALDRAEMRRHGPLTGDGHERLPVFRVGLTAGTTVRTLSEMICRFYAHPAVTSARHRLSADRLVGFALDCVLSCDTVLGIIDDIHFIDPRRKDGLDVTNHLKFLNSEFPITFIYAGVDLTGKKRFFGEGGSGAQAIYAQTGRRWTRLEVPPFEIDTETGRQHWQSLLKATEQQIVLARARPGMLIEISDYLFERSTGHIGSFFSLIDRGCYKAIKTGDERLTRDLLDGVRNDEASENARLKLAAGFRAGRLTSYPKARTAAR
jgi:hypothetical protein